jgi:hypothetical protein
MNLCLSKSINIYIVHLWLRWFGYTWMLWLLFYQPSRVWLEFDLTVSFSIWLGIFQEVIVGRHPIEDLNNEDCTCWSNTKTSSLIGQTRNDLTVFLIDYLICNWIEGVISAHLFLHKRNADLLLLLQLYL